MKKFFLSLMAVMVAIGLSAVDLQLKTPQLTLRPTPSPSSVVEDSAAVLKQIPADLKMDCTVTHIVSLQDNPSWTEWTQIGTASFPEDMMFRLVNFCSYQEAVMPDFEQPFPVMKRECTDGSSQLRFVNVFNGVNVTIDVRSDGRFICQCPTGIMLPNRGDDWYEDSSCGCRDFTLRQPISCILLLVGGWHSVITDMTDDPII